MLYKIDLKQLPDVRYSGQITFDGGWTNNGQLRPRNMMLYIIFGLMRVDVDGKTIDLHAGDYLFIPSGTQYTASLLEKSNYRYVHFSPPKTISPSGEEELLADFGKFDAEQQKLRYSDRIAHTIDHIFVKQTGSAAAYSNQIENLFRQMDQYRLVAGPIAKNRLDLSFYELLLLISENSVGEIIPAERRSPEMSEMLLWISKNYTGKITLSEMSRRFGFSKQHIIRLFKTSQKQTVIQYINGMRLQKSLEMLSNTDIPIGDLARSLGFSSAYYFTRLYTRTYGITPTEYRSRFIKN